MLGEKWSELVSTVAKFQMVYFQRMRKSENRPGGSAVNGAGTSEDLELGATSVGDRGGVMD